MTTNGLLRRFAPRNDGAPISVAAFRANAIRMSLPGSTRQSIRFEKALAKKMDARVKPGHDECFCVAWFKAQLRDLAARFARGLPGTSAF
jgi:hypothetical protein